MDAAGLMASIDVDAAVLVSVGVEAAAVIAARRVACGWCSMHHFPVDSYLKCCKRQRSGSSCLDAVVSAFTAQQW